MTFADTLDPSFILEKSNTAERKILVVEDDPEWQNLIGTAIRKFDNSAHVKYAFSAHGAQYLLGQNPHYDLIIADHFLRGNTTGLDLWKECQKKYHNTPFMMMSGMTEREFLSLIKKENSYPLYMSKNQRFQYDQFEKMLAWHLGESIVDMPQLDLRHIFIAMLFAMLPFLGLPVFAPRIQSPTHLERAPSYQMEEKLRRLRTAAIEKLPNPLPTLLKWEFQTTLPKLKIVSTETKERMDIIIARADQIISETRRAEELLR